MISIPAENAERFNQETEGSLNFLWSSTSIFVITKMTCRIAPAPIPKNNAPQIGEKTKPPNQVPKIAGAPAINPKRTKSLNRGFVFNNGAAIPIPSVMLCNVNPIIKKVPSAASLGQKKIRWQDLHRSYGVLSLLP